MTLSMTVTRANRSLLRQICTPRAKIFCFVFLAFAALLQPPPGFDRKHVHQLFPNQWKSIAMPETLHIGQGDENTRAGLVVSNCNDGDLIWIAEYISCKVNYDVYLYPTCHGSALILERLLPCVSSHTIPGWPESTFQSFGAHISASRLSFNRLTLFLNASVASPVSIRYLNFLNDMLTNEEKLRALQIQCYNEGIDEGFFIWNNILIADNFSRSLQRKLVDFFTYGMSWRKKQCFLNTTGRVGRPIMLMVSTKGLTNQRSLALTGLHLASLLGWDAMLPEVYSPLNCKHELSCYQYEKFERVPFKLVYDLEHFTSYAHEHLGVKILFEYPEEYEELPENLWPCAQQGRCRDTMQGLVRKYNQVSGKYLVKAPGIAASTVDSLHTAASVRFVNEAFKHSPYVIKESERISANMKELGTSVAVHFRFEPDALRINYAGSEELYWERLVEVLEQLTDEEKKNLTFLFITALDMEAVNQSVIIQRLVKMFPSARLINKDVLGAVTSNVSFVNAAVDFELGLSADQFVGTAQSSFSAFVALGRYKGLATGKLKRTYIIPSQEHDALCSLENVVPHWQFELQLPYNDCTIADPCSLLVFEKRHCPSSTRVVDGTGQCTGHAGYMRRCPRNIKVLSALPAEMNTSIHK